MASRLRVWSEGFLDESQCGFRKYRGVDDALETSRRIIEEVTRSGSDQWVLMTFFDIEKAYPRVCKDALWELLQRRGCPEKMIKILKALHEHTEYSQNARKHLGRLAAGQTPERGMSIVTGTLQHVP